MDILRTQYIYVGVPERIDAVGLHEDEQNSRIPSLGGGPVLDKVRCHGNERSCANMYIYVHITSVNCSFASIRIRVYVHVHNYTCT